MGGYSGYPGRVFKALLFLHLLGAIFAVGPLVHAATTAARGLRSGDATATAGAARTVRVYSVASLFVVAFGFALMSATSPYTHKTTATFGELWIWLSLLLWVAAVGIAFMVLAPTLERAAATIRQRGTASLAAGRVAASGGVVALVFAVIVLLMVVRPGS